MFKTGLSDSLYRDFLDSYQSLSALSNDTSESNAFVYVGDDGFKYVTSLVDDGGDSEGDIFATSIAGDGWIEFLSL